MSRSYPTSVAQDVILNALGWFADTYQEAEQMFKEHGFTVVPKRVGRSSVPEVYLSDADGGGFNAGGDGEAFSINFKSIDLSKISEWLVQ